ncbi:MAG: SLATT domain-containing protein [Cytophagales bacterium]|nr:SLATT domain-containing protein [Cytophagales bacterium]
MKDLITKWEKRTKVVEAAHFTRARVYYRYHRIFGAMLVLCSTLLGILSSSSLHLELGMNEALNGLIIAVLSLVVPILSAMLAFLGFQEKAVRHHDAAASFASLKRTLQIELANQHADDKATNSILMKVKTIWDNTTRDAPPLPFGKKYWKEQLDEDTYKHQSTWRNLFQRNKNQEEE